MARATERGVEIIETLVNNLRSADPPLRWDRELKPPFTDGFLAVLDKRVRSKLFKRVSFRKWLLGIEHWHWNFWNPKYKPSQANQMRFCRCFGTTIHNTFRVPYD